MGQFHRTVFFAWPYSICGSKSHYITCPSSNMPVELSQVQHPGRNRVGEKVQTFRKLFLSPSSWWGSGSKKQRITGESWFACRKGHEISLFSRASRQGHQPPPPPVSQPVGTGGWGVLSLEVMRPGRESEYLTPYSKDVRNTRMCNSTPAYSFMARCVTERRINITWYSKGRIKVLEVTRVFNNCV